MLTVHHLNNSRSQRVLWLLEELGVPYEIVRYQRQADMRAPRELRAKGARALLRFKVDAASRFLTLLQTISHQPGGNQE